MATKYHQQAHGGAVAAGRGGAASPDARLSLSSLLALHLALMRGGALQRAYDNEREGDQTEATAR